MSSVDVDMSAATDDRTGRARIRDAALARFAANGVDGTSLREIAEEAGVSQPLVIHHFGSKQRLRAACDRYVVDTIHRQKIDALRQGVELDPLAAVRAQADGPPVVPYIARTLGDGSPGMIELVDGMVDTAVDSLDEGVRSGVFGPSDNTRDRAIVLTLWSLGLLVLHDHAERLLGVDITGEPEDRLRYVRIAVELLGDGVFTREALERVHHAFEAEKESGR